MQSIREELAFMLLAEDTQYRAIFDHDKAGTKKLYGKAVTSHLTKLHEMFTKRYVDGEVEERIWDMLNGLIGESIEESFSVSAKALTDRSQNLHLQSARTSNRKPRVDLMVRQLASRSEILTSWMDMTTIILLRKQSGMKRIWLDSSTKVLPIGSQHEASKS